MPFNPSYEVNNDNHIAILKRGSLVGVKLGKVTQTGIVWNIHKDFNKHIKYKCIENVLYNEPIFTEKQLELIEWLSEYYLATLGEVLKVTLPSFFKEIQRKPKTEDIILLAKHIDSKNIDSLLQGKTLTRKQHDFIKKHFFRAEKGTAIHKNELIQSSHFSPSILKTLLQKKILTLEQRPIKQVITTPKHTPLETLSTHQQNALTSITKVFKNQHSCLLQGVTASGKTILYLYLIKHVLEKKKQALYILPEILLTNELYERVKNYFGSKTICYHSKFNTKERAEVWQKIFEGESLLIISTRSGIFLPFKTLDIIIIDEEQDNSLTNSDQSFHYNAKNIALWMASQGWTKVLLGSATPSFQTKYLCNQNKVGFVSLSHKFFESPPPKIKIIDIGQYNKSYLEKHIFTEEVLTEIITTITQDKQVIVFQNKRGYSPYLLCNTCHETVQCGQCNVNLVFYKSRNQLLCHYCGSQYNIPSECTHCKGIDIAMRNYGTEKIEEKIEHIFKHYSTLRIDSDQIRRKGTLEQYLHKIHYGKHNIIIGTQIISKGIDFKNVGLIVIPFFDSIVNYTDYSTNERAYQLLEQLKGRAGRINDEASIIIQTLQSSHPVLDHLVNGDYKTMHNADLESRKNFFYPPYSRIIKIVFKHPNEKQCRNISSYFEKQLSNLSQQYSYPTVLAQVSRIRNVYYFEKIFKIPPNNNIIGKVKFDLVFVRKKTIKSLKVSRGNISFYVDVEH